MKQNQIIDVNRLISSDYCIQFQHFQIMFEFELNKNTKISLKTNLHMII